MLAEGSRLRAASRLGDFLASSTCVGANRGRQFAGHSMVVDPWGVILASGGDEECVVQADIDVAAVARAPQPTRISSHPWGLTTTWSGSRTTTVVVGDSKIAGPLISAPGGSASRS